MSRTIEFLGQNFKIQHPEYGYDTEDVGRGVSLHEVLKAIYKDLSDNVTVRRIGVGETHTLSFSAVPDAGVWKIIFEEQTTPEIAFDADAAIVQSAIENLASIDAGDIVVAGDYSAGFTFTFDGKRVGRAIRNLRIDNSATNLTSGGVTVTANFARSVVSNSTGISLGASESRNITHDLGSNNVSCLFIDDVTKDRINVDFSIVDENTINVTNPSDLPISFFIFIGVTLPSDYSESTTFEELAGDPTVPTSGTVNVYSKNKKLYIQDSNGVVSEVGSGSGGINYISDADAETGSLGGWEVYANTAQETPITGTGGTPASTLTVTDSDPLRGTRSFLFSKDAANRQGEGFSIPFTLENADLQKILLVSLDYDSDVDERVIGVYAINEVTGNVHKVVSDHEMIGKGEWVGSFYTSSTDKNYRLVFHVESNTANPANIKIDNIQVNPKKTYSNVINVGSVEYAYNTDTSTNDADTSTSVIGSEGVLLNGSDSWTNNITGRLYKRVKFLNTIKENDVLTLQVMFPSQGEDKWFDVTSGIYKFITNGSREYGAGLSYTTGSGDPKEVTAIFGKSGSAMGSTYAGDGASWPSSSAGIRWRIKKYSPIAE